jgi:peptide/nickel transport system substrate-binding protein
MWLDGVGFFPPDTASASTEGLEALTGPRDLRAARAALAEAGAAGAPVALIGPSDYPNVQALTEVTADLFRRLGLALDYRSTDWAAVVQRRANRAEPARGGWNATLTFFSGLDFLNPAMHPLLRANGAAAWPGWPGSPAIEALRDAWLDAPDAAAQARLSREIQAQAMRDLPYVPLGQFFQPTAYRRALTGMLKGPTLFWNLRLAAG